jgi:hypothetical protein
MDDPSVIVESVENTTLITWDYVENEGSDVRFDYERSKSFWLRKSGSGLLAESVKSGKIRNLLKNLGFRPFEGSNDTFEWKVGYRKRWECPSCKAVHWDFKQDECKNGHCPASPVDPPEAIVPPPDPQKYVAEVREYAVEQCDHGSWIKTSQMTDEEIATIIEEAQSLMGAKRIMSRHLRTL